MDPRIYGHCQPAKEITRARRQAERRRGRIRADRHKRQHFCCAWLNYSRLWPTVLISHFLKDEESSKSFNETGNSAVLFCMNM